MSERAYHFVGPTLRDGRPIPADGEWLIHEGDIAICASGLHASSCPFDALKYAPGHTLCLVDVDEVIERHNDKLVARRRRIVARLDAGPLLWAFARACARDGLHLWSAPDVVRRYLETGDESLRGAAKAAALAARLDGAAWYAAQAAAMGALDAGLAAQAAARAAARSVQAAARGASDADWAAAWAAARDAQRARFRRMVDDAFREVQS